MRGLTIIVKSMIKIMAYLGVTIKIVFMIICIATSAFYSLMRDAITV